MQKSSRSSSPMTCILFWESKEMPRILSLKPHLKNEHFNFTQTKTVIKTLKMHSRKFLLLFKCFLIPTKELHMTRTQIRIHLVQIEGIIMRDDIEPVMICLLQRISLNLCSKTLPIHNTSTDNSDRNRLKISNSNSSIRTSKEILYLV